MLARFDKEGFWLSLWLLIAALSVGFWPNHFLSLSLCFTSILISAYAASRRLIPNTGTAPGLIIMTGTILGGQSLLLTLAYYSSIALSPRILAWSTLMACALILFVSGRKKEPTTSLSDNPSSLISWSASFIGIGVTIVLTSFIWRNLIAHATSASIRSPWPYLHPLLPFFISVVFIVLFFVSQIGRRVSWLTIILLGGLLSISLITPLVYTQGFGFDGFLHRESARLLFEQGVLEPKPFYYIGQYTLVIWIKQFFHLSIASIDRYLLSGLLFVLAAAFAIDQRRRLLAQDALILFCLPLTWLVATTPQSLAYLFGFTAIILHPRHSQEHHSLLPAWIFGCWSLVTHPLAGLPFLVVLTGMSLRHSKPAIWRNWMNSVFAVCAAFAVPGAFFLFSLLGKQAITWDFAKLLDVQALQSVFVHVFHARANASLWPDWVNLIELISPIILFCFAFLGARKTSDDLDQERETHQLLLLSGTLLFAAGYFMRVIGEFSFLIAYERSNYADRLFTIGLIMLALPAATGLYQQWQKPRPALLKAALLITLIFWQSARVYAALPRHDAGSISHGWSVSQADIEAVRWIDQDAGQYPYAVLTNQSMSAAAIETLGFKRYVDDVFFYPVPTGGELYQLFLQASSQHPLYDTITEAGRLTKSDIVYVAIHHYWWDAERVREQLKTLANNEYTIDSDAITVYRFDLRRAVQPAQ